jgi:hypothetical protein
MDPWIVPQWSHDYFLLPMKVKGAIDPTLVRSSFASVTGAWNFDDETI